MRPEIKINDRVRFRTDGEIGEMMKVYREFETEMYGDEPYIVTGILGNGMLHINDRFIAHQNELDICNDFSDIQVGDEVETSSARFLKRIVKSVDADYFQLVGDYITYASKLNGELTSCNNLRVLRITKKAEPKQEHEHQQPAVGSLDWAIDMMKAGEHITRPEWGNERYCHVPEFGGMIMHISNSDTTVLRDYRTWKGDMEKQMLTSGWQIYKEPEPHEALQPKYRVGDYVICKYHRSPLPKQISYERVIDVDDVTVVTQSQNGNVCVYDINGNHGDINGWHIDRVISPCEHIVTIGCLSGTIGKSCEPDRFLMWHSSPKIDFDYSIIKFSAIDKETLELVESLLKAQSEESCGK